jgi:hypothetical protein
VRLFEARRWQRVAALDRGAQQRQALRFRRFVRSLDAPVSAASSSSLIESRNQRE